LGALLADPNAEVRGAAALALSRVGEQAAPEALAVAKLLKDADPQARGFAALALRNMGKGAAATIPELSAALQDPVPSVRMTAASALRSMGAAASSAVPALVAELEASNTSEISGDDVQVIRNICYALADIGPSARSAIPTLQKVQHLRIRYIAQEAINKIEGHPSPTWH
jgi:HEAT repeat protein